MNVLGIDPGTSQNQAYALVGGPPIHRSLGQRSVALPRVLMIFRQCPPANVEPVDWIYCEGQWVQGFGGRAGSKMGRKALVTLANDAGWRLGEACERFQTSGEFLQPLRWKDLLFPGMAGVSKGVFCSRIRGLLLVQDAAPATLDQIDAIGIAWAGWLLATGAAE